MVTVCVKAGFCQIQSHAHIVIVNPKFCIFPSVDIRNKYSGIQILRASETTQEYQPSLKCYKYSNDENFIISLYCCLSDDDDDDDCTI